MRIVVTDFLTLDGVIEAPGFEEHRDGRNGWALRVPDDELQAYNQQQSLDADGFLFGRTTYQIWAAFWPTGPDVGGLRDRITELPKYVLSKTLEPPDWANTIVLRGSLVEEVERLRALPGGDLLVYGSADLVNGLLANDLIDEYRLLLFPLVLGSGKHLFRDDIETRHLRLLSSRTFPSGVVLLVYDREPEPSEGDEYRDFRWTPEQIQSLRAAQDADRVLATILFTDIVGSTEKAAELGDADWRSLLERHDAIARREVEQFRGRVVKNIGDGMFATFDGPARAIRCAESLCDAVRSELGLQLRAGVHTGECEAIGEDLGGMAVHIGSRVAAKAAPYQVLVSGTVKDLVVGSGLAFDDAGEHELKGVPGSWRLYRVAGREPAPAPIDAATDHMTQADKVIGRLARRAPGAMRALTRLTVKERATQ